LYPIFTSDDIKSSLPQETKNFNAVKANWNENTRRAKAEKLVLNYCNNKELSEQILKDNEKLDSVQKKLGQIINHEEDEFCETLFFVGR